MKVLKTADTSKWSYKFTCGQCDSQLEAERGDVKHEHYAGDFREPSYNSYSVSCPICQRIQTVPTDQIPKALQVQIKNKQFSNMKNEKKISHISYFTGDNLFLSNFYPAEVELDGVKYPSVEHAYQAAKTTDTKERKPFHSHPLPTAAEAKKLGKSLDLRSDWEGVKLDVMEQLLIQKFAHPDLKEKLLETGDALLVEGNYWGDTFWGVDKRKGGQNRLGKLLMKIRNKQRE